MIRRLETALDEIRGQWVQSTGGESVCAMHKHGTPSALVKYHEGREFIVRRTIGLLNKGADRTEILAFLSASKEKFHRYRSSGATAASAWQAYADGGLDGIALIRATLRLPSP